MVAPSSSWVRGPPARLVLPKLTANVTQGPISICRGTPCGCPMFAAVAPLTGDEGRHPDGPDKIVKFYFRQEVDLPMLAAKATQGPISICRGTPCGCPMFAAVAPLTGDEGRHLDGPDKIVKLYLRQEADLPKPAAKVTQGPISICRGNPCGCPTRLRTFRVRKGGVVASAPTGPRVQPWVDGAFIEAF